MISGSCQAQTEKHPLHMTVGAGPLGLALFPISKEGSPISVGWFEDSGKAVPTCRIWAADSTYKWQFQHVNYSPDSFMADFYMVNTLV